MFIAKDFEASDWRDKLPVPVYEPQSEWQELYEVAWESVRRHVKDIPGMPQTPYMDEAFCHTLIWIWDTCFMSLFCKYAPSRFPGVESLKNFYETIHDGKPFPLVTVPENEPAWLNLTPGTQTPVRIDIADNPPLFAWAEYENALMNGDLEHVRKLLLEDRYLQRHYEWLENLTSTFTADWLDAPTCWVTHENGYEWEGGRSGMDNSPRGRLTVPADKERPGTPDTLWLDALAQQAQSADCIAKLFELIGRPEDAKPWHEIYEKKADILRTQYWCDQDQIFYDISATDGHFYPVPTIASFWPLAVGAATEEQAEAMAQKLEDQDYFGGERPLVTLARKDPDFVADGGAYCRGTVWMPTAYMTMRALVRYGKFDLARRVAKKLLTHLWKTYHDFEPHSIWESYSPSKDEPAKDTRCRHFVRKDFCGWSALGPIAIFIENVIGIYRIDGISKRVYWNADPTEQGKVGVRNLTFADVTTSLVLEDKVISVESDGDYTLIVNGREWDIKAGAQTLSLD